MHLGSPIQQACDLLGDDRTCGNACGGIIHRKMPFCMIFLLTDGYLTTAIRLIAVPLVVFFVFGLFVHDLLFWRFWFFLAGMPVASNGTMLSLAYSGDTKTVARVTFFNYCSFGNNAAARGFVGGVNLLGVYRKSAIMKQWDSGLIGDYGSIFYLYL